MRRNLAGLALLGLAAACGGPEKPGGAADGAAATLEGDAALIAAAQKVSDAIGGCVRPKDAPSESKVVSLENGAIVMLACSQGAYSFTNRLFAVRATEGIELLSLPDYDTTGWFASDQVAMPELDAGSGVLTTMRKSAGSGACGSEGRYKWDGLRFALEELHWKDCGDPAGGGPPFPVVWPVQPTESTVDATTATPEP